jgi:hypothetical protein
VAVEVDPEVLAAVRLVASRGAFQEAVRLAAEALVVVPQVVVA